MFQSSKWKCTQINVNNIYSYYENNNDDTDSDSDYYVVAIDSLDVAVGYKFGDNENLVFLQ